MKMVCFSIFAMTLAVAGGVGAAPHYLVDADFGAACDGSTNDYDDLQDAFDMVKSGGILEFPAGATCVSNSQLMINNGTGFLIEGNGATILSAQGLGGLFIKHSHGYEIRDLTFDGNRDMDCSGAPPLPEACGCVGCSADELLLRGSTPAGFSTEDSRPPSVLNRVRVINSTRDGFRIKGYTMDQGGLDDITENLTLLDCQALDNARNGVAISAVEEVLIAGGLFARTGDDLPGAGIDIENTEDQLVVGVEVRGAVLEDNFGAGLQIGFSTGAASPEQIDVIDNDFRNNQRNGLRSRGSQVNIVGNRFEDFTFTSGVTEDATLALFEQSRDVLVANNTFEDIETGLPALWVQEEAERFEVSGNLFDTINTVSETGAAVQVDAVGGLVLDNSFFRIAQGGSTGPAILFEGTAEDGVITGNQFFDVGPRALWAKSDRTLISGNAFECGRKNVMWVSGEDSLILGNVVGPLAVAGSSSAADSVIRYRKSGGMVVGNTLSCIDDASPVQRGLLLDLHPSVVAENTVNGCDPAKQIQYLAGFNGALTVDKDNTVSSTGSATCSP